MSDKNINTTPQSESSSTSEKTENRDGIKPIEKRKSKEGKKKRRGFSGIIWNQVKVLNDSEYFQKNYSEDNYKFLLIATDDRYAALMTVNGGKVDVDGIKNKPPINPKDYKWDGMLRCDIETFFALAQGKLTTMDLLKMVIKRQIRGVKAMMRLAKYFSVVGHIMKQQISTLKKDA